MMDIEFEAEDSIKPEPMTHWDAQTRVEQEEPKKPKKTLLKKKKKSDALITLPSMKKIYTVGSICVVNEESIRDPDNSTDSFVRNSLYFNKIVSIQYNSQFFTMNLKRNDANYLTEQYLLDRYRSFNDLEMKQLADNLERIMYESDRVQEKMEALRQYMGIEHFLGTLETAKVRQQQFIENFLKHHYKDQKYLAFHYANGVKGVGIEKLIISTQLLQETGFRASELIQSFSRQKTLSFELMGSSAFKQIYCVGSKAFADYLQYERETNQPLLRSDPEQMQVNDLYLPLKSQLYCRRYKGDIEWEEKVKCNMKFCKPFPFMTVLVFEDAIQKPVIMVDPKKKTVTNLQFDQKAGFDEEMRIIREGGFEKMIEEN